MNLQQFIQNFTNEYIPLYKEACESYWEFTTTGNETAMKRSMEADKKLLSLFADSNRFEQIKSFSNSYQEFDAHTKRITDLLLLEFTGSALTPTEIAETVRREKEIENDFTTYRAIVLGEARTENWLREQLKHSTDASFRKEVWEGSKQIGGITGPKIRELAKLRNSIARRLGFPDFWTMRIILQELDPDTLISTFDQINQITKDDWKNFKKNLDEKLAKKFHIDVSDLRPWHYSDPFFQEAPEPEVSLHDYYKNADLEKLTKTFYQNIGLPIDSILTNSDLYEREGKQQHAYCMSVDRADDIRILCNIKPNENWMSTMLHEFGHGVYDKYIRRDLPFLLRIPAHTLTTEAIAMLMERNVKNPTWLRHYLGVPEEVANNAGVLFKRNMAEKHLIMSRWCMVMVHFERALYQDPDQDLDNLWWDLVEKFQEVKKPENRTNSDWAAKIHIGCSPVYYQNYLLGDLMASQIQSYIKREVLKDEPEVELAYITSPKVGQFLMDHIFSYGKEYYWNDLIEMATGKKLDVLDFAMECKWEN
ncbi:MAG: M2 family metallopeptidase [bacterium]|nr:M2 family metallopeptidase [bacterium]